MQDSDQQTEVAECWVHQRSLSLVSSERQAVLVELLSLNPSSDHEQQQLYHQLLLWHRWWFYVLDFFVFRIWHLAIWLSSRTLNKLQRVPYQKPEFNLSVTIIHQVRWTDSATPWLKQKLSTYFKFRDIIILSVPRGAGSTYIYIYIYIYMLHDVVFNHSIHAILELNNICTLILYNIWFFETCT